jgi:hypothetical protein
MSVGAQNLQDIHEIWAESRKAAVEFIHFHGHQPHEARV